jgi:integral membrane protein
MAVPDGVDVNDELFHLRRLRMASFLEGSTLLVLLLIAVPLKHAGGWATGVQVMGPLHGFAFLAYAWLVLQMTASATDWSWRDGARLIVLATVPGGGFFGGVLLSSKMARLYAAAR